MGGIFLNNVVCISVGLHRICKVGQALPERSGVDVVIKDAAHGIHAIAMCPCFLHNFTAFGLGGTEESIDVGKGLICLAFEVKVPLIVHTGAIDHDEGRIAKYVVGYRFTCIEAIIGTTLEVSPYLDHSVVGMPWFQHAVMVFHARRRV